MRGAHRWVSYALAGVVSVGALSGCAQPDFRYSTQNPGTAPAGDVYLKVPYSWAELSAGQITNAQSQWASDATAKNLLAATSWQTAFDASQQPSVAHVLGTGTTDQPTVYASLRNLFDQEKSAADTAALRDMIVPLSTLGNNVHILKDDKVTQGSAKGVHVVFSYVPHSGSAQETVDQTALLSDGNDAVYLLLIRCSTECYNTNRDAITSVTSSYTIQEGRHG